MMSPEDTTPIRANRAWWLPLLLCLLVAPPLGAQTRSDTSDEKGPLYVKARFFPSALYSGSAGFGLGAGAELRTRALPGASLLLVAKPAQHRGVYQASLFTAHPYQARLYGLLGVEYRTVGRQWYYGVGPATSYDNRVAVELESVEAEARLAWAVRPRLLVQPVLRLLHLYGHGASNWDDGAFERLDQNSQANLRFFIGDTTAPLPAAGAGHTNLAAGVELAYDTRDQYLTPRSGLLLQLTGRRAFSLTGTDLHYDTFSASVYGFIPIGERQSVVVRAIGVRTVNRGDVPIPFYLLPSLEGKLAPGFHHDRFFGSDLVLLSSAYFFPLFDALGLLRLEGAVGGHLGAVYDDVTEQFALRITLDETLPEGQPGYALRPALGFGLRLSSPIKDRVYATIMSGYSAEGFSLVTLRFVHDLRLRRPLVR